MISLSGSSSFAVGIQKESRALATSEFAAKLKISSSMAEKEYGFLGGM